MKKHLDARSITTMALLIAMMVTLSRILGIETQFLKVSFTFIPEIIMGMLFGPFWTGIGSVIADFVGMSLFAKAPFFRFYHQRLSRRSHLWILFLQERDYLEKLDSVSAGNNDRD